MWFKKLLPAKFVSPTKSVTKTSDAATAAAGDIPNNKQTHAAKHRNGTVSMCPLSAAHRHCCCCCCNCDRKSTTAICSANTQQEANTKCISRQDKRTFIDNFTIAECLIDGQVAYTATADNTDDIETAIVVDDTSLAIETVCGIQSTSAAFSCVTDVNEYSNGENDCDLVSKSTDSRLQQINDRATVRTRPNPHTTATSITVNVYCNEPGGQHHQLPADKSIDEWPTPNSPEANAIPFGLRQVHEVNIESCQLVGKHCNNNNNNNINNTNNNNNNSDSAKDSDCDIIDNNLGRSNQQPTDESSLCDWVVISMELKPIGAICDESIQSHINDSVEYSTASIQYYTTSEICAIEHETIVTLHCNSSQIDTDPYLMRSVQCYNDLLGTMRNQKPQRRLWLQRIFSNDIRVGIPTSRSIGSSDDYGSSATFQSCTDSINNLKAQCASTQFDFASCESFNRSTDTIFTELEQPCSSSKQKASFFATPIAQSTFTSMSSFDLMKPTKKADESVAHAFGLNDYGDIIIHTDHICEETGFGFLARQKRQMYRKVQSGKEMVEKRKSCITHACKRILKLCAEKLCQGHPRNKSVNGGAGDSIGAYALALAKDTTSTFSRNIENFITCTKDSRETSPQIVMRNMRQFMSGMKNYLVKHGEGDFQQEVLRARSMLKSDEFLNLDTILEGVMHQLVVLPLREHLYGLFVDYYSGSGDIQLLVENVKHAYGKLPVDFGIRSCIQAPSTAAMQQISLQILRLQEAELPLAKLEILLAIVNAIIETTSNTRGQALGADDFLPLLVYIVAKCGFIGAEIEAEFMWCLLQPSLLNGEAGYYLTALCSAVHVLKSFITSEHDGTGSLDFRSSSLPACSSVLRVIIPDEYNGSLQTRTLPIRPHTTTREVCRTIAHKARVTNPQDYGLFKLVDGEETLLMENDCPQEARLQARGKPCMLAYKRIDAKIAWPTTSHAFH